MHREPLYTGMNYKLPANSERDRNQFRCPQAVGLGDGRGVDGVIAGFPKLLHGTVSIGTAQTVRDPETQVKPSLIRAEAVRCHIDRITVKVAVRRHVEVRAPVIEPAAARQIDAVRPLGKEVKHGISGQYDDVGIAAIATPCRNECSGVFVVEKLKLTEKQDSLGEVNSNLLPQAVLVAFAIVSLVPTIEKVLGNTLVFARSARACTTAIAQAPGVFSIN